MSAAHAQGGDAARPAPERRLPDRPSLEQLRKQAKDLLRAARAGDASANARIAAIRNAGERPMLSDSQLALAREYGFASWSRLVHHVEGITGGFTLRPLIRPVEMSDDDVYAMFVASRDGDLRTVKRLVDHARELAIVEYNYTPPIHFAVREGHREIVGFLIVHGADLAYRSYPFGESLLGLAEDREHHEIAALLRERLSHKFAIGSNASSIIAAAREGNIDHVRAELARDPALARTSDETGDTALHQAAGSGHLEIVNVLLDAGADIDAVRGNGDRPIHSALMPHWSTPRDRTDAVVEQLLARGARYTIFIAAARGDIDYVRDALARDRSLANFEDDCHYRPISAAANRDDIEMVKLLLAHGANPALPERGAERGHALWGAVHRRHREIVSLLLAHDADPNGMVESSGTPMMQAQNDPVLSALLRAHGGHELKDDLADAKRLVDEGKLDEAERLLRANREWLDNINRGWGDGILAGPARDGRIDIIEMLMRLGARVPLVSKWAPYYYFKHEKTAAYLLDHGMDPNHMNWHRFTLLHHMAADGELAKARLLVDHGADVDAIDDEYRSTPLGIAARWGRRELVSFLLDAGADPTLAGATWATPIAWAERKGHQAIVDQLRAAVLDAGGL